MKHFGLTYRVLKQATDELNKQGTVQTWPQMQARVRILEAAVLVLLKELADRDGPLGPST